MTTAMAGEKRFRFAPPGWGWAGNSAPFHGPRKIMNLVRGLQGFARDDGAGPLRITATPACNPLVISDLTCLDALVAAGIVPWGTAQVLRAICPGWTAVGAFSGISPLSIGAPAPEGAAWLRCADRFRRDLDAGRLPGDLAAIHPDLGGMQGPGPLLRAMLPRHGGAGDFHRGVCLISAADCPNRETVIWALDSFMRGTRVRARFRADWLYQELDGGGEVSGVIFSRGHLHLSSWNAFDFLALAAHHWLASSGAGKSELAELWGFHGAIVDELGRRRDPGECRSLPARLRFPMALWADWLEGKGLDGQARGARYIVDIYTGGDRPDVQEEGGGGGAG